MTQEQKREVGLQPKPIKHCKVVLWGIFNDVIKWIGKCVKMTLILSGFYHCNGEIYGFLFFFLFVCYFKYHNYHVDSSGENNTVLCNYWVFKKEFYTWVWFNRVGEDNWSLGTIHSCQMTATGLLSIMPNSLSN